MMNRTSEIRVNRLPMLTYRYLHTNDTKLVFPEPETLAKAAFSDMTYVSCGGDIPDSLEGASPETRAAALSGERYRIDIPEGTKAALTVTIAVDENHPDYAGAFEVVLEKNASLSLIWKWEGEEKSEGASFCAAVHYELKEGASLKVSKMQRGLKGAFLCDQRDFVLGDGALSHVVSAEMGGETVVLHSRGWLYGKGSTMKEKTIYAADGTQNLDLFYHAVHYGEESQCHIDAKGSLSGKAKKLFRSTIDFKRGCSGAVGDEGDYAIQLSPEAKNISLPLLLCTEDNVVGNHASSAGQLDKNTIYYLMTRGLSEEEARRIAVESLIRPLIDELDPSLQDTVLEDVREKLSGK